jgi:hypothetical protein
MLRIYLTNRVSYSILHNLENRALFSHKTGGRGHWRFLILEKEVPPEYFEKIKENAIVYQKINYQEFKEWLEQHYGDCFYFPEDRPDTILVKENKMGWIIGKKGWRIKTIQRQFKRKINLIQTKYLKYAIKVPTPFSQKLQLEYIERGTIYKEFFKELKTQIEKYRIWDNNFYKEKTEKAIKRYFEKNHHAIKKKRIWQEIASLIPDLSNWGFRSADWKYDEKYHKNHPFMQNQTSKTFLKQMYILKRKVIEKEKELEEKEKSTFSFRFSLNLKLILINYLTKVLDKIPQSIKDLEGPLSKRIDIEKTFKDILECYNFKKGEYTKRPNFHLNIRRD